MEILAVTGFLRHESSKEFFAIFLSFIETYMYKLCKGYFGGFPTK
jgi:hypothetical protein